MKTNYLKWLLFVFVAVIFGLVVSHFSDTTSFYESTTMIIASLALLRTCKEEDYFYLVTHADYGTPMKAKYHDDMGGYFEIMSKRNVPIEYVNPILGKSKIKYFMPLPEMPDDYKE